MNERNNTLLKISGVCALAGPPIILGGDLMHILFGHDFAWSILMWIGMLLTSLGIVGFTWLCVNAGSNLAYIAGVLAYFGSFAGGSMQVLFRTHAVLTEQGNLQAVEALKGSFKLVASTQMIGLAFPIGLILLALIAYRRLDGATAMVLSLLVGAVLFPIGRIGGFWWAVIGSGVFLSIAFVMLGLRLFGHRGERAQHAA